MSAVWSMPWPCPKTGRDRSLSSSPCHLLHFGRRFPGSKSLGQSHLRSVIDLILDDQRDPAVGRVFRLGRQAGTLIGKAAYLRDLVCPDPFRLHHSPGLVGAIGRQIPVVVSSDLRVWGGIGVALD